MVSEQWRAILNELSDSELRAVAGMADTILLGRRNARLLERRARGKSATPVRTKISDRAVSSSVRDGRHAPPASRYTSIFVSRPGASFVRLFPFKMDIWTKGEWRVSFGGADVIEPGDRVPQFPTFSEGTGIVPDGEDFLGSFGQDGRWTTTTSESHTRTCAGAPLCRQSDWG